MDNTITTGYATIYNFLNNGTNSYDVYYDNRLSSTQIQTGQAPTINSDNFKTLFICVEVVGGTGRVIIPYYISYFRATAANPRPRFLIYDRNNLTAAYNTIQTTMPISLKSILHGIAVPSYDTWNGTAMPNLTTTAPTIAVNMDTYGKVRTAPSSVRFLGGSKKLRKKLRKTRRRDRKI